MLYLLSNVARENGWTRFAEVHDREGNSRERW